MLPIGSSSVKGVERAKIHHLIGAGRVIDCFRGSDGAPCRGWIPACAGMTEVGDLGRAPGIMHFPSISCARLTGWERMCFHWVVRAPTKGRPYGKLMSCRWVRRAANGYPRKSGD